MLTKAPVSGVTVADSISAGLPRDRIKALAAVTETNGAYISVTDDEILAAIPALARGTGVFAEPAGAAAYAGLVKAVELGLVSRRRPHCRPQHRQRPERCRRRHEISRNGGHKTQPGGAKFG